MDDDYEVVRPIGSGSFGQVFLVLHKAEGKQFVMKSIELSTSSSEGRKSTEQEVQLLNKMRHPSIVSYWDSFVDSAGYLCILMEYCEHGDVYTYLQDAKRTGRMPGESDLVEWFIQITLALQALHSNRILHRDLKTQNIFLTGCKDSGVFAVKLGDFGIAKVLNSTNDLAKTQIGTPFYMSPELINNKPYGVKTDIWSLGCILYEIINGQRAFDAQSLNGLALKIIKCNYTPITSSCSASSKLLIKLMLSRSPNHRPTLREILHNAAIRTKLATVQRNVVAAAPAESHAEVSQAITNQLISLGLSVTGEKLKHISVKIAQRLQRAERRKQHEEEVLHHTMALLSECFQGMEAPCEKTSVTTGLGSPRAAGVQGSPRGVPVSPRAAQVLPPLQIQGSPRTQQGQAQASPRTKLHGSPRATKSSHGSPRSGPADWHSPNKHGHQDESGVKITSRASNVDKPVVGDRNRADFRTRTDEHSAPAHRPGPELQEEQITSVSWLMDYAHIGHDNLARPFENCRPNVVNSPKLTDRRKVHAPAPPQPQYGGPHPPNCRPERSGGFRTGELRHASVSGGGFPRHSLHGVFLESLPNVANVHTVAAMEVEHGRQPGHSKAASVDLSDDSLSSGSLTEVQEVDEWVGFSDELSDWNSFDESAVEETTQRRPHALRKRIDDCKAAIQRHKMTIEMLEYSAALSDQTVCDPSCLPGATHVPRSDRFGDDASAPAPAMTAPGWRSTAPVVVQDCAARLLRRCLEGLGNDTFQTAMRCWMTSLDAAEKPTQARNRMVDVLGLDKIGFLSMLDQLVHLERRWGSREIV